MNNLNVLLKHIPKATPARDGVPLRILTSFIFAFAPGYNSFSSIFQLKWYCNEICKIHPVNKLIAVFTEKNH